MSVKTETSRPGRQEEGLLDDMVPSGLSRNKTEVSYGP
jgi:hypothetical protein